MSLSNDGAQYDKIIIPSGFECDTHNRMKLSYILRHMQEISSEHLEALGLPYLKLYGLGQVFLLSKIQLTVLRRPEAYETLRWVTTPKMPSGAQFLRCNDVYDARQSLVLRADTLWMLVDPHTRRILRPAAFLDLLPDGMSFYPADKVKLPLAAPEGVDPVGTRAVYYSDLDVNRHMNNADYADIVCDYLPEGTLDAAEPTHFLIHYQSEALLHTQLQIFRAPCPGGFYIRANKINPHDQSDEGKCFESSILLQKSFTDPI